MLGAGLRLPLPLLCCTAHATSQHTRLTDDKQQQDVRHVPALAEAAAAAAQAACPAPAPCWWRQPAACEPCACCRGLHSQPEP